MLGNKDDKGEVVFSGSKNKHLFVHIMQLNKEVAVIRKKIYDQDVTWKKRMWAIDSSKFITDKKGKSHQYVDVNKMAILTFQKSDIQMDAKNARDLLKRKTITAIWGVDSMPMMLIIVMAIACLMLVIVAFYLYSDIRGKDAELTALRKPPIIINNPPPSSSGVPNGVGSP